LFLSRENVNSLDEQKLKITKYFKERVKQAQKYKGVGARLSIPSRFI
jgi:hypothetical protein